MTPFLKSFSKRQNMKTYRGFTHNTNGNYWIKEYIIPGKDDDEDNIGGWIFIDDSGEYIASAGDWTSPDADEVGRFDTLDDAIDCLEGLYKDFLKTHSYNRKPKVKKKSVKKKTVKKKSVKKKTTVKAKPVKKKTVRRVR